MPNLFEEMAGLDRLVHEPARLAILTALGAVARADFVFLQRVTGLTVGNLSSHITKLSEAGLVSVEKQFVNKRPNTLVEITPRGREAVERHWQQLEALRARSQNWKPEE
jgi:DNA-binding MarR family transcriptional regulator